MLALHAGRGCKAAPCRDAIGTTKRCLSIGTSRTPSRSCAACGQSRDFQTARSRSQEHSNLESGHLDPYNALVGRVDSAASSTSSTSTSHGHLYGWTTAIKTNFCIKDINTTCSSRMLQDFKPNFDAAAVALLRDAGAQLTYQTNCDEFGMGSSNVHSIYGPVRNPAHLQSRTASDPGEGQYEDRVAGGSSGGSAAAVRAGLARIALGSDTGGSVRLPAAYCGVTGLKPSYGLISRWGLVSYADSLDTVGVLAMNTHDTRETFQVLSAHDSRDPTSASPEARSRAEETATQALSCAAGSSLSGLRIGIPQEYFPEELHPRVLPPFYRMVSALQELGADVVPVSLPSTPSALSAYYIISCAEASSNLARYDGVEYGHHTTPVKGIHPYAATRSNGFGEEVRKRILLGSYVLTADAFDNYFLQASRVRKAVRDDFQNVLRIPNPLKPKADVHESGVDVLLHPSAVNTAPTLADSLASSDSRDPLAEYVQDVLTVPASLAGLPAMTIPAGSAQDDGWPVGVTLVSQWGCEPVLFKVAAALEAFS